MIIGKKGGREGGIKGTGKNQAYLFQQFYQKSSYKVHWTSLDPRTNSSGQR
jgi:hypothetical protein